MKQIAKKIILLFSIFILLFICGIAISDIIIIARAKNLLSIADSLHFEKNSKNIYPELSAEKNSFSMIKNLYDARQKLPDDLRELDRKITTSFLRSDTLSQATLRKFWNAPEVVAITGELSSVPYTAQFSFNYLSEKNDFNNKMNILRSMHKFYLHYLKFCASEGEKLQTLHVFQKLLVLNNVLKQHPSAGDMTLQHFWINSLDALVHYGPTEKRYEDYYNALKQLVDSIDFKYNEDLVLTICYENLQKSLQWRNTHGSNIFSRHTNYINNIKADTKEFYSQLRIRPLAVDLQRNPMLAKDIFAKNKTITQTHLKTLIMLKLYQLKHGSFPEAIEGFPPLPFRDELVYKRISPGDFVLHRNLLTTWGY